MIIHHHLPTQEVVEEGEETHPQGEVEEDLHRMTVALAVLIRRTSLRDSTPPSEELGGKIPTDTQQSIRFELTIPETQLMILREGTTRSP
jgi:hypothetical protein